MVVDGTGLSRRRVDVGVRDGRVVKLAHLPEGAADREIDATASVVAPGIVDVHTHYDPQITFDPYAAMSSYHGVTTVVAGNCGFSVAPTKAEDRPFLEGIFAAVENMDPIALSGVAWKEFETFPEFLESREGRLGVNFACYVGHSNLRRWVMGEACTQRAATADEVSEMAVLLREALAGRRRRPVLLGSHPRIWTSPTVQFRHGSPTTANCWRSRPNSDATAPARWPSCR